MPIRPCPKPPKTEKKQPKPIQRKTPLPRSNKPIRKKSAKLAKLERNRKPLTNGVCWKCGTPYNLHKHEIFYGDDRQLSMEWDMVAELCAWDHDVGPKSVHLDPGGELDASLKKWGQEKFEEIHPNVDFLSIFGKNYK